MNIQNLHLLICVNIINYVKVNLCHMAKDTIYNTLGNIMGFPCSSVHKDSACSAGDLSSIPGLGRSPGEGHGNPFQYPCLENLTDRGAWWAAVHGVTKSRA